MSKTRCEYNWHNSGRQVFYDGVTYETLLAQYPVYFYDDFHGADVVIPAIDLPESGCKWVQQIVGAAPPTVAKMANEVNGVVLLSLTADDQKQDAAIHMDDQLTFSIAQGAIFEARIRMSTLPTLLSVASWGLWGAWADGGSLYRVGFEMDATGLITCESDDNATDTSASSGVTATAAQWKICRIDCTTQSDIKFFIDGVRVASGTTFNNAASAGNSICQPYFGNYKASGEGLGVMKVDYVKIWQNRA